MNLISGQEPSVLSTTTTQPTQPTQPRQAPEAPPTDAVVVIEPRQSSTLNLRELWAYHELLYFLTWRDIKVRYKQTILGVLWVLLQPLFMVLTLSLFFGKVVGISSEGLAYPLFAFAGILPWTFLSSAIAAGSNSMTNSAHLVSKVYFPRLFIPAASVAAALFDFAIMLTALGGMMVYYRIAITPSLLMLPVLIALLAALASACGILTSALNVKYRDVRVVIPFIIQIWFFVSPIIYPVTIVPDRWRWILSLNPMTGIIDGFRVAIVGHKPFDWRALGVAAVITAVLLILGLTTFKRMERKFADII